MEEENKGGHLAKTVLNPYLSGNHDRLHTNRQRQLNMSVGVDQLIIWEELRTERRSIILTSSMFCLYRH